MENSTLWFALTGVVPPCATLKRVKDVAAT